jgi:predicted amidohydrolase
MPDQAHPLPPIVKKSNLCYISSMIVRAVQFSPTLGDIARNMEFHLDAISQAVRDHIDLIVFPELSLSGYHLKDIVYDIALTTESPEIKKFRILSRKVDVVIGAPIEESSGIIHNCALYFSRGELQHRHRKVQLPNFGMFEERMIFKQGDRFDSFGIGPFAAGMLICREILFPIHAYLYFLQKTDFLIGISASPFRGIAEDGFSSFELWESMGNLYSQFYHQNYLFVNRVGFEDGIGFGGGSFFARAGVGIVQKAKYFADDVLDAEIRPEDVRRARISTNYYRDEQPLMILKEMQRILR